MNTAADIDVFQIPEDDGLLFGCLLDGNGGGTLCGWAEVEAWSDGDPPFWVHLDRSSTRVQRWIKDASGLTEVTAAALLADEDRPRTFLGRRGTTAILRGVNTNPGANPEDMVTMRLWSDGKRVISIRQQRLITPRDVLHDVLVQNSGPCTAAELFEKLISRLNERIGKVVAEFDEWLDEIEAKIDETSDLKNREELRQTRQDIVVMRRYIAPQREAVNFLYAEPPAWLDDTSRLHMRETANRLVNYIENLDEARERAIMLDDGIANRQSEKMNKNLYVLSIMAAIFLPLGFITGLFGINVGGMPGVESPFGFWVTCLAIAVLLGIELVIFRKLNWI